MVDYPVVSNATLEGTTLTLDGFVGSAPGQATYSGATIEFFKAENTVAVLGEIISGDSQSVQHGQAASYLGSCIADSDGTFGLITSCQLSVSNLSVFDQITATSTHINGSTSEFGANADISGPYLTSTLTYELTNDLNMNNEPNIGDEVSFTLTTTNSGNASASNLALNIPVPSFLTLIGNSVTSNYGSIISGNSVNDSNVIVNIASLGTEEISVITFKATILGNGTIELQATISSDNYPDYLSDDPEIAGLMDPTVLNVQAVLASTGSNSLLLILTGIVILLTSLIHKISRNLPSLIKTSPVL